MGKLSNDSCSVNGPGFPFCNPFAGLKHCCTETNASEVVSLIKKNIAAITFGTVEGRSNQSSSIAESVCGSHLVRTK